jgi:hypothetical protein
MDVRLMQRGMEQAKPQSDASACENNQYRVNALTAGNEPPDDAIRDLIARVLDR